MDVKQFALEPGYIVFEQVHIRSCTKYQTRDFRSELFARGGRLEVQADWHTEKTVHDADEDDAVKRARTQAINTVRKIGFHNGIAVYVPAEKREELEKAIEKAYGIMAAHNSVATCTEVYGSFLVFDASVNDKATADLLKEVTTRLEDIEVAISRADPEAIRKAIGKVRRIEDLLPRGYREQLKQAFESARFVAKRITKKADEAEIKINEFAQEVEDVNVARALFCETYRELPKGIAANIPVLATRVVELAPIGEINGTDGYIVPELER